MEASLYDAAISNPAVQQQEGAVIPVRDPKEDIVAGGEQEKRNEVGYSNHSSSITDNLDVMLSIVAAKEVGVDELEGKYRKEDLGGHKVHDVEGLAAGWHDTEIANDWCAMATTHHRPLEEGRKTVIPQRASGEESKK